MIRLTKQADYGIVLLTELALTGHAPAAELAARTHLPGPMVSKILKLLVRAGLLVSDRGIRGGYRLARSANDISIADAVVALEGPIALTECSQHAEDECSYEAFCRVRSNWQHINRALRSALEGITIGEMKHSDAFDGEAGALPVQRSSFPGLVSLGSSR